MVRNFRTIRFSFRLGPVKTFESKERIVSDQVDFFKKKCVFLPVAVSSEGEALLKNVLVLVQITHFLFKTLLNSEKN